MVYNFQLLQVSVVFDFFTINRVFHEISEILEHFQLCFGCAIQNLKVCNLKSNTLCQKTSNFTFTNILRSK